MRMGPLRVAFVCLFLLALVGPGLTQSGGRRASRHLRSCSVPRWPRQMSDVQNPLVTYEGKVVLVALMKGYCGYCVNQAARLENLKNELRADGLSDIAMVLVNGGEEISRENIQNLQDATTSLPVIQDTENHHLFRRVFGGNKDDFIIYDRCGQRAFLIPHPYSYLGHTLTERVLRYVYAGRHSCHCDRDNAYIQDRSQSGTERMQGDQPMGMVQSYQVEMGPRGRSRHGLRRHGMGLQHVARHHMRPMQGHQDHDNDGEGLQCPEGDSVCERYVQALNDGRLGRPRHRNWNDQHSPRRGPSWLSGRNRHRANRIRMRGDLYHRRRNNGHVMWRRGRNNRRNGQNYGGAM